MVELRKFTWISALVSRSRYGHDHHKFADDTQLHQSSTPSDFHWVSVDLELHQSSTPSDFHWVSADLEQCVDSIWRWMTSNRLKLNYDKTEAEVWLDLVEGSDNYFLQRSCLKYRGLYWRYSVNGEAYWPHNYQHISRSEELALWCSTKWY